MALEPGDTQAIINAVQGVVNQTLEDVTARMDAVELMVRQQSERPVADGNWDEQRVGELELAHEEVVTWLKDWSAKVSGAIETHNAAVQGLQMALVRLLAGDVETDAWRAWVLGESVRLGIRPQEIAKKYQERNRVRDDEEKGEGDA